MKREGILFFGLFLITGHLYSDPNDLVIKAVPLKRGELFQNSQRPALSADGRWIVFESLEPLVSEDKNKLSDVYLYDRESEGLRRIPGLDPFRSNGGASISPDGRVVVFHTTLKENLKKKTTRQTDIVVYEVPTDSGYMVPLGRILEKEGEALFPRFPFTSDRVLFSYPFPVRQIYLFDRLAGRVKLLTRNTSGALSNRACGDARLNSSGDGLVFRSAATNFISGIPIESLSQHLYYLNHETQFVYRIDDPVFGFDTENYLVGAFDIDETAQTIVFEGRTRDLKNHFSVLEKSDLFLFAGSSRTVEKLTSGIFSGRAHSPSLSADGTFLTFVLRVGRDSKTDPAGVVIYDMATRQWKRVASGLSANPMLSADGRVVVFEKIKEKKRPRKPTLKTRVVCVEQNPFLEK